MAWLRRRPLFRKVSKPAPDRGGGYALPFPDWKVRDDFPPDADVASQDRVYREFVRSVYGVQPESLRWDRERGDFVPAPSLFTESPMIFDQLADWKASGAAPVELGPAIMVGRYGGVYSWTREPRRPEWWARAIAWAIAAWYAMGRK